MTTSALKRLLEYVQIDTQSDSESTTYPSTARQLTLLNLLVEQMIALGLADVEIDANGYVTGRIPSNCEDESEGNGDSEGKSESDGNGESESEGSSGRCADPIAFIAHVDTSPDVSGRGVRPRIVNYTGGDIVINQELGLVIGAETLDRYHGHNLVVTDGTTLLGADDKAGVAEIMAAAEYLISHPDIKHGDVWLLFTPDEEIGRGVDHFNRENFAARYAYTVDGGASGSLEWETFNAASADITIQGINYHPGYALNKMVNSQYIAMQFASMLPTDERPETTDGRDGFFHLTSIQGSVESTTLHYIIRDHDRTRFARRKEQIEECIKQINEQYGPSVAGATITDQYYNMGDVIRDHYFMVEIASEAMHKAGIQPLITAVRGGTDGSRLSFMGLPCPNIFSGAENIHSRLEFVSEQVMNSAVEVIINIAQLFRKNNLISTKKG